MKFVELRCKVSLPVPAMRHAMFAWGTGIITGIFSLTRSRPFGIYSELNN